MATRNILKDGERGLLKKSREVTDFNKRLHILLDDMRETLIEANGLGLAAPQVGVLRRAALIVDTGTAYEFPEELQDDDIEELTDEQIKELNIKRYNEQIIELVNPVIINKEGEQTGNEGCLSLPGVYGIVTRPETVLFKAYDRNGKVFELEVYGLTARAVCHELDHLDGVIFTTIAERLLTEEELAEKAAQRDNEQRNNEQRNNEQAIDASEKSDESNENNQEAEKHHQ